MQAMMDFTTWFISQLPGFLMSEPISAFTGLGILFVVVRLVSRIMHMCM